MSIEHIRIVDSHTGGEPTRLVISGGPDLGSGSIAERARRFAESFDHYRSAIVNEPRGSDVLVGALLLDAEAEGADFGVIFFNNVGLLGMCGHGLIGVVATLAHLGRLRAGTHRFDTPVGVVTASLAADGAVRIGNVPSYRKAKQAAIEVPGFGVMHGDIAWGGNWFFLVDTAEHRQELTLANVEDLVAFSWRIRQAVNAQGFPEVDHVELFAPAPGAGARNFVLCPGKAYDRSPCGTGTSAKLACLALDGKLSEGETWIQESILGSRFEGSFRWVDASRTAVLPVIEGRAYVNAEATLILDPLDPFRFGIRPA